MKNFTPGKARLANGLLGLFFIATTVAPYKSHAQANKPDSMALVDLYNSTSGSTWTNHTNWLSKKPLSVWYGVEISGGFVTQLNLGSNNLKNSLPASLFTLTHIFDLDVSANKLTGAIPSALGSLVNLKYLVLSNNQFSGAIPSSIGSLTKLMDLYLDGNQFTGAIPSGIGSLVLLTDLSLAGNQLTGAIPSSVGSLSKLQHLYLNNNQLSGAIPSGIGSMSMLMDLFLYSNQLTGAIPTSLGNLTKLQYAYLNNNLLTGAIPAGFGSLPALVEVYFSGNQLSGNIPDGFDNLNNTSSLHLENNKFVFNSSMESAVLATSRRRLTKLTPQAMVVLTVNADGSLTTTGSGKSSTGDKSPSRNTATWYKNGVVFATTKGKVTLVKGGAITWGTGDVIYATISNSVVANMLKLTSNTITIGSGFAATQTAPVTDVESISRNGQTSELLYPNPVINQAKLQLSGYTGSVTVTMSNMAGKIVLQQDKLTNGTHTLALNNLPSGMYVITINDGSRVKTLKLLKAK